MATVTPTNGLPVESVTFPEIVLFCANNTNEIKSIIPDKKNFFIKIFFDPLFK